MQLFFDLLIAVAVLLLTSAAALNSGRKSPGGTGGSPSINRFGLIYIGLALGLAAIIVYRSFLQERYHELDKERSLREIRSLKDNYGIDRTSGSGGWSIIDSAKYKNQLK